LVWIVIFTLTLHLASPSPFTVLHLEINVEFTEIFERWLSICSHRMWTCAYERHEHWHKFRYILTYTTSLSTHMRTYYFFNVTDSATFYHVFLFHDARVPCVLLHVTYRWFLLLKFSCSRFNRVNSRHISETFIYKTAYIFLAAQCMTLCWAETLN